MQPKATNPSYLFILVDIITGISNAPGEYKTFILKYLCSTFFEFIRRFFDIFS